MLRHEDQSEASSEVCSEPQEQTSVQAAAVQQAVRSRTGRRSGLNLRAKKTMHGQKLRPYLIAILLCILSFLFSLPTMALLWHVFPSAIQADFAVGTAMMFGGLLGIPATLIAMSVAIARAASPEPLPREEGVHAIGPLLDRMETDLLNFVELRACLAEMLPLLQPEHASLLEPRQYEQLNVHLNRQATRVNSLHQGERPFLLAVLDAYSRIGDTRSLPDVTRIAQGKAACSIRDDELMAAAQRCQSHLEAVAEAVRQKETLLRISEAPPAKGILLRPAHVVSDPDPGQLLRPGGKDTNVL